MQGYLAESSKGYHVIACMDHWMLHTWSDPLMKDGWKQLIDLWPNANSAWATKSLPPSDQKRKHIRLSSVSQHLWAKVSVGPNAKYFYVPKGMKLAQSACEFPYEYLIQPE